MTAPVDALVADYLARLDDASRPLPPDRRAELLEEIGGHIETARAAGAAADEAAVRTLLDRLGPPEVIVAAAFDDDGAPARGAAAATPPHAGPAASTTTVRPGTGLELAAVLLLTAGSLVPVVGWLTGVVLLWSSARWRTAEKLLGTAVVPLGPGGVLIAGALFPPGEVCSVGVIRGTAGPIDDPFVQFPHEAFEVDGLPPEPPPEPPVPLEPPADLPWDSATAPDTGTLECTGTGLPSHVAVPAVVLAVVASVAVAVLLYRRAVARAAAEPPRVVPVGPSPWGALEIAAVLALALGSFAAPVVGPVVGLVLAWLSPRWTSGEKAVATLLCLLPLFLFVLLPLSGLLIGGFAL